MSARYHSAKIRIPASAAWTKAQGIDFSSTPTGLL